MSHNVLPTTSRTPALLLPRADLPLNIFEPRYLNMTLDALKELVQAAGLRHPHEITAHHIVRRINDNEVRLLANLVPQVAHRALLDGNLGDQHNVFRYYWTRSSADSFSLTAA